MTILVAMFGCGNSTSVASVDAQQAVQSGDESLGAPCSSFRSVTRVADQFTNALAEPGLRTIRPLVKGRFEWFSIGAPQTIVPSLTRVDHFTAFSPKRFLHFKRRNGAIPVKLNAVGLLVQPKSDDRRYSDFAYSGRVIGRPKLSDDLFMGGKGAINCDGTVRVWSMFIAERSSYPPGRVCGPRSHRKVLGRVNRVDFCLQ